MKAKSEPILLLEESLKWLETACSGFGDGTPSDRSWQKDKDAFTARLKSYLAEQKPKER